MTDSTALEAAFRGEQIHVWQPPPETANRIVGDISDSIDITEFQALNPFIWAMSATRPMFQDIRIREAFYRAFDPTEHITLVADGWAVRTTGKLAQGLSGYLLDEGEMDEFRRFDPDEARRMLDASGFDFDQVYSLTTLGGANNEQSLQVFHEQLRRIGVDTNLDVRPASEWLPNVSRPGNFDLAAGVGFPAYDHPQSPLRIHHSTPHSINEAFNMRDPEIDAMIEASEVLTDRDHHIDAVKEIQRELFRQYSNLDYIMTFTQRELRWSYVRDWEFNPTFAVMFRPEAWLDV